MKKLIFAFTISIFSVISFTAYANKASNEIVSISPDTISYSNAAHWPALSFEPALDGKVAGVQIVSKSGQTGSAFDINIRNTISYLNSQRRALYIIDGIAVNSGDIGGYLEVGNIYSSIFEQKSISNNILNSLAPSDIESVVILKDAAATAIYGEAGAYGVVLITTKKGEGKKFNVQFNSNIGISPSFAGNYYKTVPSEMNRELMLEMYLNTYRGYTNYEEYAQQNTNQYIPQTDNSYTNWGNELYRNSVYQNYDLSVYGNINDKTKYYISGAYTKAAGRSYLNDADRYSARVNFTQKLFKNIEWNSNIFYSKVGKTGMSDASNINNMYYMERAVLLGEWQAYNQDGSIFENGYGSGTGFYNPLYYNQYLNRESDLERTFILESLKAKLFNQITLETRFGYDNIKADEKIGYDVHYPHDNNAGSISDTDTKFKRLSSYNYISWDKVLAEKHKVHIKGGFEFEKYSHYKYRISTKYDINGDELVISKAIPTSYDSFKRSYIANASYEFKNKYSISASLRYENNHLCKYLPDELAEEWSDYLILPYPREYYRNCTLGIAASWNIAKEMFLQNISWISALDLKLSYSKNISKYAIEESSSATSVYDPEYCNFSKADIMLNGSFLNNRLNLSADYFMMNFSNPAVTGIKLNSLTGEVESYGIAVATKYNGIEMAISGDIISTNEWKWSLGFNLASIKSKLDIKNETKDLNMVFGTTDMKFMPLNGESPNQIYGYSFAGVDPQTGYALWYKEDGSTTTYNHSNTYQTIIGCTDPKAYGGINTNISWRGLSLNMDFTYSFGGDVLDTRKTTRSIYPNYHMDILDRWQNPGDITNIPALNEDYGDYPKCSDMYLYKNNYLRLKHLNISYSFPKNLIQKMRMSQLQLSFNATNLLTFAKNNDFDPQTILYHGRIGWNIPLSRTYTFGVTIGF